MMSALPFKSAFRESPTPSGDEKAEVEEDDLWVNKEFTKFHDQHK